MNDIFRYDDYREFLRANYEETKKSNPNFSYRYISQKVGFQNSYLGRLFRKDAHLALDKIAAYADVMKLSRRETLYFEALVRYGRARGESEKEKCLEQLKMAKGIEFSTIQQDEEEFFSAFHHVVIRSLLGIHKCTTQDYRKIASMVIPNISTAEAEESVKLLVRLGMVNVDDEGFFHVTTYYISTSAKWSDRAIHEYQAKNIELSREALDKQNKKERDISTLTFTVDRSRLPLLREKLSSFREEVMRFSDEGENDNEVMHLNLQLFPVGRTPENK